jgi:hypothetical protein
MSIDLRNESVLGLAQAATRVPSTRGNRPVNPSTLCHDQV